MTATDELRRMLDERGVEYEGGERSLRWRDRNGVMMQAFPLANGELGMEVWSCTPEQAIAATLGAVEYRKPTTLSQLEAENAKLRELVRALLTCATDGECDECRMNGATPWHVGEAQLCDEIWEHLRELGVEVEV